MNLNFRLTLSAVVLTASTLISCSSTPPPLVAKGESDAPFGDLYTQAISDLRPKGYIVDVGIGIDKTGRFDLALQKATLDGQEKVAAAFETKVEGLRKNFAETLTNGDTESQELNETFTSVTKAVISKTLNGVQALSKPKQIKYHDSRQVDVGILIGVDPKTVNTAFLAQLQGANAKLYERFRATQGFEDLQKEIDNYDKSSK